MIMDCRLQKTDLLELGIWGKQIFCGDGKDKVGLPASNSMGDAN